MQIYFSPVPQYVLDTAGSEDYFWKDGVAYYYSLETSEETLKITDTCNRYVPFDQEDLKYLASAIYVAMREKLAYLAAFEKELQEHANELAHKLAYMGAP